MPTFVYSTASIAARYEELVAALPAGSDIFYSVKANGNHEVLLVLAELGLKAEVSSLGELHRVRAAGFRVSEIIYGGPGKEREEIEQAAALGVRRFSIESLNEMRSLDVVAQKNGFEPSRIVRVLHPSTRSGLNMMTPHSKFGLTLAEVEDYLASGGRIDGVHLYYGTQQKFSELVDSIGVTNAIVEQIERAAGYSLQYVNYGGGLQWPFMKRGTAEVSSHARLEVLPRSNIFFEFGRYLVASCGTLKTRVIDAKMRDGHQVLVVDAGVHTIGGLAATGRVLRADADFDYGTDLQGPLLRTAIYGPLCTPADYMTLSTMLPQIPVGAVLNIPNCGAYGANTGLTQFLSRAPALEVVIA